MKRTALSLIVLIGLLVGPASAQERTMEMPADVYATMRAVTQKFPHTGSDDERRAAMEKAVATLRARHGVRWVWKTEHQSLIAPSKDGLGYVPDGAIEHGTLTSMYIWDTINGGSRQLNAAPLVSEAARKAYVLAVTPKDWLAGELPPTPGPPPNVEPPTDGKFAEILKRLDAIDARLSAVEQIGAAASEIRAAILELRARPFPDYSASLPLRLGTLTLRPIK